MKQRGVTQFLRSDLDPGSYYGYVLCWLQIGVTLAGVCCGAGLALITRIKELPA
jgi:hypothetical protein